MAAGTGMVAATTKEAALGVGVSAAVALRDEGNHEHIQQLTKHLLASHQRVRHASPPATVAAIGAAIHVAEQSHDGESRFAPEGAHANELPDEPVLP